jgi:hypothetical protein
METPRYKKEYLDLSVSKAFKMADIDQKDKIDLQNILLWININYEFMILLNKFTREISEEKMKSKVES